MTFKALFEDLSYRLTGNSEISLWEREVKAVTADPNATDGDAMYICTVNALWDGHERAVVAYAAGCRLFVAARPLPLPDDAAVALVSSPQEALAALSARFWGYPERHLTVFGITGTAGKSSVAYILADLLAKAGKRTAVVTTDGVWLNGKLQSAGHIVPNAGDIRRLLALFVRRRIEFVILELSAYMLAQRCAFSIPFAAILHTGLLPEPVGEGEHPTLADCERSMASLFTKDAPFWVMPAKFAEFSPSIGGDVRLLTFGDGGDAWAKDVVPFAHRHALGSTLTLHFADGRELPVSLPVPGDIAVKNALAASVLAQIAGLDAEAVAAGLSDCRPFGRMECLAALGERYIFADTAYTAASLRRALQTLRPYTKGHLKVLVGSVGGRAHARRAPLGAAAVALADHVYLTADDPDCEDPRQIAAEMTASVRESGRYEIIPDREAAIRRAVFELRPGDVLLLAGKGGQSTQLIRGVRHPFSEREILQKVLEEAPYSYQRG